MNKIIIVLIFILVTSLTAVKFFTTYHSAFEADQACHASLNDASPLEIYGCDHDIETRQWLLYINEPNNNMANVVERFRY